jgi:uncharacterized phage protein (TIGR02218 family)
MSVQSFNDHLKSGLTQVCRCWAVSRADGVTLGFTDHDLPLSFDGITFEAQSGMGAMAISSATGLAVDNTEAVGVLSTATITEQDIAAGRYDDADVTLWQVCWADVSARRLQFRGRIGEISRSGDGFQADLRGLTDLLNQPQGRSYLRSCSAVLGDAACRVSLSDPNFALSVVLDRTSDLGQHFDLVAPGFDAEWFSGGFLEVLDGVAHGLRGAIKRDQIIGGRREITLWQPLGIVPAADDTVKLIAGCDKRAISCQEKFNNMINFQGFPDIPGDDWLMSVPRSGNDNTGGSLR